MKQIILGGLACLAVSACVPQSQYHWGDYSRSLYNYYGDSTKAKEYREALVAVIVEAEPQGRVPPGIYAELGYMELQAGNSAEAKQYFEKEKARWPESAAFMDRMIAAIDKPPEATPPASGSNAGQPGPDTKKAGS